MKANPVLGIFGCLVSLGLLLFYAKSGYASISLYPLVGLVMATWVLEYQAIRRKPVDFSGGFCFCLVLGLAGESPAAILLLLNSFFIRHLWGGVTYPWDLLSTAPSLLLLLVAREQASSPMVWGLLGLALAALILHSGSVFIRRHYAKSKRSDHGIFVERQQNKLRLMILPFAAVVLFMPPELIGTAVFAFPLLLAVQLGVANTGFKVRAQAAESASQEAKSSQNQLERVQGKLRHVSQKQKLLEELVKVFDQSLTPEQAFRELLLLTQQSVPCRSVILFRLTQDKSLEPFRSESPEKDLREKSSLTLRSEPLVEKAWEQDRPFRGFASKQSSERLLASESALVVIPLKPYGVLYFGRSGEQAFSTEEAKKLLFISSQAEAALVRAEQRELSREALEEERLRAQFLQQRVALSSQLLEASQDLTLATSSEQVLGILQLTLEKTLPESSGSLRFLTTGACPCRWGETELSSPLMSSLQEAVNSNGRSVYLESLSSTKLFQFSHGLESALAAPLLSGLETQGILVLASKTRQAYGSETQDFISTLACLVGNTLEGLKLNLSLQKAHEQVVQASKLSAVGQLAATVAHELNTPLATIRLAVEAAMIRPASAEKTLARAEKALDRAQQAVSELLKHTRVKNSDRSLVHMSELLRNVGADMIPRLAKRKQTLEIRDLSTEAKVYANENELQQVLNNLLSNASDASDEGASIGIRCECQGDEVVLQVRDQGPGIPEAIQSRIFEPFFTTKKAGQGTGLGLSVCRELVQRHHGKMTLSTQSGDGTTFQLSFPARQKSQSTVLDHIRDS